MYPLLMLADIPRRLYVIHRRRVSAEVKCKIYRTEIIPTSHRYPFCVFFNESRRTKVPKPYSKESM